MLRTFKAIPAASSNGCWQLCGGIFAAEKPHDNGRTWKQRRVSVQQKRLNHDAGTNLAHIAHGGNVPLLNWTVGELVGTAAERWPNKVCLVSVEQDIRLTFSELLRRGDRLAAGLRSLGLRRGDRVGIWGPNQAEWLLSFVAIARAGMIVVAINPAYQQDEINYCLEKVGVAAVISPKSFKSQNYPGMLLTAMRHCPSLRHIIINSKDHVTGTRRLCDVEELPSRGEVEAIAKEQEAISCYDGSNIQFTSGTTGRPKAALLSHRGLVNNARQVLERMEMREELKACMNVPFFHVFGVVKSLEMMHAGTTIVLESPSFNPVKSIEAILKEKCEIAYGTPTMWINLLDTYQRLQPPPITLYCGVTGGSPASPELFKRIRECFRFDKIKTIYGQTEATAVVCQSLPGEAAELTETTIGHISCHTELKVVDSKGETVPFGTVGELLVRSYGVMIKYWDDEENTKKTVTEDGWMITGDQFILRSDGYGHIVGRLKDMVIRGGENIYPKEVEDFLMTHPQVLEAQVVGVHDDVYGEEMCACVRVREGARITKEELREYGKGRIAHYKIPRYIEFVDEYPKTTSGKVQKFLLKQEMERSGAVPASPRTSGRLAKSACHY
nr:medium-chain acyl-CoA ligase ACSF2, mitochondrial [Megalopta genalis]XP_033338042.1 medium-chain acyl-CoA ligase ACSF2, mitochondrial [Megalopta genalis]